MPLGTPKFVGARLREGREARGLSASSLASVLGISRQAVFQYERDESSPRPETMRKIVDVLRLPVHFFQWPMDNNTPEVIFYRSLASAQEEARLRGKARRRWLEAIASYMSEYVEFPAVNLPNFDPAADPNQLTEEAIEDVAGEVRRIWGLGEGPISHVVWLVENHGAIVARDEFATDAIDAFSTWDDGSPYIILGSDKGSAVRSRLDAAHELAHLLLHRNVPAERLQRDRDHALMERQANRFAAALLLPAASFSSEFYTPSLDILHTLKSKWLVSIGMMIHRLADLEFLSRDEAKRWWIAYTRRGWKRREPLDESIPQEQPTLLRRSLELLVKEGVQSRADIRAALPLDQSDIEELSGLPRGYLEDARPPAPVLRLPIGRTDDGSRSSEKAGADIVLFPSKHRHQTH